MEIKIFDVEHGDCALITTPNNKTILIDCGHNETTGFRPSKYLNDALGLNSFSNRLTELIISNVDQDHLSDIVEIRKSVNPEILSRNPHIDRAFLFRVKEEITQQFEEYADMHEGYNAPIEFNEWGGVEMASFFHSPTKFSDTNNLSLIKFFQYGGLKILFSGDLEKSGWLEFLKNDAFIEHLKTTNVFIASHHGREAGYCPEIFKFCNPEIILISDGKIQYDTQKDIGYSNHAKGILFNGSITKKILTTRSNGMITLRAGDSSYNVNIEKGL